MSTAFVHRLFQLSLSVALATHVHLQGQDAAPLYLISGWRNAQGSTPFPASLHLFDEHRSRLIALRTLVSASEGTNNTIFDSENRIWASTHPIVEPTALAILTLDAPQKTLDVSFKTPQQPWLGEVGLFAGKTGSVIGCYLRDGHATSFALKEVDLRTGTLVNGSWEDYKFLRLMGPRGGIQPIFDGIREVFPYADGQLVFRVATRSIETGLRPPPAFRYDQDDTVLASVLTDRIAVLCSKKKSSHSSDGLGRRKLLIADRTKNDWHEWIVPGDASLPALWGNWLALAVSSAQSKQKVSPNTLPKRTSDRERETFAEYWRGDTYFPGTLLLYDLMARKQYSIHTGEGDSEVLLIENRTVYYRTHDKIWRASIGAGSISDQEMLVKADIVPDVHWAFRPTSR